MSKQYCIYPDARWGFFLKFGAEICGCHKFTYKTPNWS
jgi:hypothetical protein